MTVGVIANPLSGTDVRRLSAPAGHTSNAAKVGIVERVVTAAIEAGATRVLVANDAGGLGAHAAGTVADARVELLDEPMTGTRADTVAAARRLWKDGCSVVVVLGGDGTCRDAAIGWPAVPMIAVSTGTNNVFPDVVEAVAVGTAAGLVASGRVPLASVSRPAKRLVVHVADVAHIALVDVAVLRPGPVGARAVLDAGSVLAVVAAISTPLASGLSSIAGRLAPLDDDDPDAVVVRLRRDAAGGRRLRVPLVPGAFSTVDVASVDRLRHGDIARFDGPLLLAFDGERDVSVPAGVAVTVTVDDGGPTRVDVGRTLRIGAQRHAFDDAPHDPTEDPGGY
jgi:hypothetical protein